MTDPHKLVERVRELTEHDGEGPERELRIRDRPPRSSAQRERVEGVAAEAARRESTEDRTDDPG